MRLQDEAEDIHSNDKVKQLNSGIKYVANGRYGNGTGAWKENRCDSASKRRDYQRMNRNIRMKNLENLMKRQKKYVADQFQTHKNKRHSSVINGEEFA